MFSIDFESLSAQEIISLADSKLKSPLLDWERSVWRFVALWMDDAVSDVPVFTSGSTGASQSILLSKVAMTESARMTANALGLESGNKAMLCLPASKISGMMMLVRGMVNRMPLFCLRPSVHPLRELKSLPVIDFAAFTPLQFSDIIHDRELHKRVESIRKVILGGEDIRYGLKDAIQQMKNEIYATFGMTETVSHIALKRLNGTNPDLHYKTLPGIEVSADEHQRLLIHAHRLGHENLLTKDIVQIISSTEFEWLGRADNMLNRGGIKIFPEQIEKHLQDSVRYPFFITEWDSGTAESRLALVIEAEELSATELMKMREAFGGLDKWSRPREIWICPAFSRTDNGKIKRQETLSSTVLSKV